MRLWKTIFISGFLLFRPWEAFAEAGILTGEVEGAAYAIRLPEEPAGKVLLFAHGYWPETMPREIDPRWSEGLMGELVEEGWIIGTTSYRRNGWVLQDAARDLENLFEVVSAAAHGDPGDVYVMGESMGGGVGAFLAENPSHRFDGILAMGAYLFAPIGEAVEGVDKLGAYLGARPEIPVLFLTNTSELAGPRAYVTAAATAPVPPALWMVEREGHVNLNKAEKRNALEALVEWVETGKMERKKEATIAMQPSSTATFEDGAAKGVVSRLVPVFGNFITSFVREDFNRLGIAQGMRFELTVNETTVPVLLGSQYGDVPEGDWVGFWEAEGYLLICRNYRNAVETLGIHREDDVRVRPLASERPAK
jgi:dienelactone hydrolase